MVTCHNSSNGTSLWELSLHIHAVREMTSWIWSVRKEVSFAISITELTPKSFGAVLVVLVPLQVGSAWALMKAYSTRGNLPSI